MRTAIIISHKGEAPPSIQFGDATGIKAKFRELVESGGGGADVVEMWTSSSGRSKRRKFTKVRQVAAAPETLKPEPIETATEEESKPKAEAKPARKGR